MERLQLSVKQHGFDGVLYPVQDRYDKIIIVMSGSEGGLTHACKLACYFQEHNFPAIAVGYFKTRGTKNVLSQIPVEYMENVISWLKKYGYHKIAIEGLSKGAEYALACATTFPEITCVILKTPSWFYSEGLVKKAPSHTCCWTYMGKDLPYTPYKSEPFHVVKRILKEKELNILSINTNKEINKDSIIPVERVNGPILIFSTESDTVWPSAQSGDRLEERLTKKGFSYPHKHVCFKYMSHVMLENANRGVRLFFRSEKSHPVECAKEREIMGDVSLEWVETVW